MKPMTQEQAVGEAVRKARAYDAYAARRDRSIIIMNAKGCSVEDIAAELSLHPITVHRVLRSSSK